MKVLAINSSPHNELSCTTKILKPLLAGMKDAKAKTEIVYLNKLKMLHCTGCMSCWIKTPGKCVLKDDVAIVLKKYIDADLIIYATPLYVFSVNSLMKIFLDRSIPLAKIPNLENKKTLLVSPGGLPKLKYFESLIHYMRFLAKFDNLKDNYLGEILRPSAGLMHEGFFQNKADAYYKNLKIAGKQLIENNKIDKELYKKLHAPWMSPEKFSKICKEIYKMDLIQK